MPENKKKTRGNLAVMGRLVGLVKPLAPVMVAAVLLCRVAPQIFDRQAR